MASHGMIDVSPKRVYIIASEITSRNIRRKQRIEIERESACMCMCV